MQTAMQSTIENLGFSVSGIKASSELETVTITNPVKRKPGRYPQPGWTPTVTVTRPKATNTGQRVTLDGSPASFAALWQANIEGKLITPGMGNHNQDMLESFAVGRESFCGGSPNQLLSDLSGKADLSRFMQAKEKVESSDLMDSIRKELESVSPRRRRIWSDNGQWVEDRRFEPEAFEDFKRQPSPVRSINFELQCAENCEVSARKIAEFGATAWAIVDALESSGLSVGLRLLYSIARAFDGNEFLAIGCNVKNSGEYVSPSFIAGIMTPNFYRRVIFSAITTAAESCAMPVSSGLGHAKFYEAATYNAETCTIQLSSSAIDSPALLAEKVIEAIRSVSGGKAAA